MARIIPAFKQFLDDSGDPLISGSLRFTESGTNNSDKTTYADINESIPNANPVLLDGAGRCPNIFGTGSYRVVSYDADMQQIEVFDPVGGSSTDSAFSDWTAATIYSLGDIKADGGGYYSSLQNNNQGNSPSTAPGFWEKLQIGRVWSADVTYSAIDSAYGSDGQLYYSQAASNTGNNPISDPVNWSSSEPADSTILKDADIGATVQAYSADTPTLLATQAEMEAGAATDSLAVSPELVKQAIDALAQGGAWELIDAWTPTAVNAKDWSWDETLYSDIRIVLSGIGPASDEQELRFALGYNNGASFFTGSGDYGYSVVSMADGTRNAQGVAGSLVTLTYEGVAGAAEGVGNGATEGVSGKIELTGGGSVTSGVAFDTNLIFSDLAGRSRSTHIQGALIDPGARSNAIDSIRLLWESGNFKTTGAVYIYGLKRA